MPAPRDIQTNDLVDMLAGVEVFLDEAIDILGNGPEGRIRVLYLLRRAKRWMLERPDHEALETLHSLFSDINELPGTPDDIKQRIRNYYATRYLDYRLATLERWRQNGVRKALWRRQTDTLPRF